MIVTSAKEVMWYPAFIYSSLHRFFSSIAQKVTGGFGWNFQRMLELAQLRGD